MGVADVFAAGVATGASAADEISVGATCATGATLTLSGAGASVIGVALGAVGAGGGGPSKSASLFCNSRARACHASARPRCLSAYDTQSRIAPS